MISYPVSLPASASPRIVTIKGACESSVTESPFTAEQQVQSYPVDRWQAEIEYPIFDRAGGEALLSRLLSLYGAAGVFYLGDDAGATPRGAASGSPVISGASQSGRILLVSGCTPSITGWLKEGDWLQSGWGYNATLVVSNGGTGLAKYFYNAGTSINAQKYVTSLRIKNLGSTVVQIGNNLGQTQNVASGAEVAVKLVGTGNGSAVLQVLFNTLSVGDGIVCVAWDPVIQRFGVDENLVALAGRNFTTGWVANLGASISLNQNVNQRLHKVVNADVDSDSGGLAAIDLWPRLRESPIAGLPIVTSAAKGLFRLADDVTTLTIDEALKYGGLKFTAMEAY
jgi:hypothetical protein